MRTPLSRVRGLGAAHHGTEHFWMERLSGAFSLVLLVICIGIVITLVGRSHATVISTLSKPLVAVIFIATIISFVVHMRLVMQVVIEDYVHTPFRKISLLMLNTFFCWGVGLASVYAILKISFGP